MKAYVLAAGFATRLYPLARDRAKPLLEVAGAPILSHIVGRLLRLEELSEIIIVTNTRFHDQFLKWASSYPASAPIRVLDDGSTAAENKLGALGDLSFAVREVPPNSEDWLVVAGDNLFSFDLGPLFDAFREARQPMLVLRGSKEEDDPKRYNEVTLGEGGRVTAFREKPLDSATGLAAIALYFFTPVVVPALERYLREGGERDAPGHFISWLVEQLPVRSSFIDGAWFDVGNAERLAEARRRFGSKRGDGRR